MIQLPKISCTIVTKGRVALLKKSIQCYLNQTYKNRELVVLSQGSTEQNLLIRDYIKNRQDIQFFEAPQNLTLGAMRNLSIEIATGSVICQWDDDDLYHPYRLVTQYRALLADGVVASLYDQHLKYFSDIGQLYWIDWSVEPGWRRYLCGSIMFRKYFFHQYRNMLYPEIGDQSGREEDMNVLIKFSKLGKLAPVSEGYQYIYVFHGDNVYDLAHHKLVFQKKVLGRMELLANKEKLIDTFRILDLENTKVCSLDEIVFQYQKEVSDVV